MKCRSTTSTPQLKAERPGHVTHNVACGDEISQCLASIVREQRVKIPLKLYGILSSTHPVRSLESSQELIAIMDTHDVSDISQYMQIMAKHKKVLQLAKARQGDQPGDRRTREELLCKFMMRHAISQMQGLRLRNNMNLHSSFVSPPYAPSCTPLKELSKIFIKDLRLETHHRGAYVLVRSITPPEKMTAVMAIVEDESEDAVMLQLYQQDDSKGRPATSTMKQDDVFLIKEPYFKVMADGEYGLRVDHVTDIIYIEVDDTRLPSQWFPQVFDMDKTAGAWKSEGNDAMKRNQYWTAILSYSMALRRSPSPREEKLIRLNRAMAYLKDDCFDAAILDTRRLTCDLDFSEKALYRASQALYKLGRFSECQETLTTLCEKYPNNCDAVKELTRTQWRLKELESGVYDFRTIYEEAAKLRPPHLDHATFTGPVTVKTSMGRGRGLFTTKAVKAGELIMCEKAFVHCYANTTEESTQTTSRISVLMNIHTNRMTMGVQSDLLTEIVQKLRKNPSLLPEFMALHHGSYQPVGAAEVDGVPIIDTFLVEHIISLNGFGCPLSSRESHLRSSEADEKQHHSCGIWLMASSINHSCLSNVRRSFIGDLQLVHAARDIPAGTELTFWYRVPTGGRYEETQKGLQGWEFQCDCTICIDGKSTPKMLLKRRDTLLKDLQAVLLPSGVIDTAKAERLLATIDQTYRSPPSKVPRVGLFDPYLLLMRTYMAQQQATRAVPLALKALECLGFVIIGAHIPSTSNIPFEVQRWGLIVDRVVEVWVHLCNAYKAFAPHLCEKAKECAAIAYRVCVGEDMTFDESYGAREPSDT
ncbi:MAG: hypothetical protein M1818_008223 [Claussenomyces sp. TS43310]|nr:MAG: hypothetical protein M1818_008223 [Claussenomyces sp. TS43310]